jgi:preprotein translocase subunit SecG
LLFITWVVFHVLVCFALIIVVLMQSAKGEGLSGGTAFGGAVSTAVFGGRGAASFLSRATTVLAIVFFINCGALALMSSSNRVTTTGSGEATTTESAVTRRAQEERDAAMQRQQQQNAAAQDSIANQPVTTPATPADTTGN